MPDLLPLFVNLRGRRVVVVGAGPVAASKLTQLTAANADVLVVAPEIHPSIAASGVSIVRRAFVPTDLDGAWLVVAAAPASVNHEVATAAEARRLLVNAVDDPPNASAYLGGVVRRDGVTVAISTSGAAPAIAGLLREAIDVMLPQELDEWMAVARDERLAWKRDGVPMERRRPLLLQALNRIYDEARDTAEQQAPDRDPKRVAPHDHADDPQGVHTVIPVKAGGSRNLATPASSGGSRHTATPASSEGSRHTVTPVSPDGSRNTATPASPNGSRHTVTR